MGPPNVVQLDVVSKPRNSLKIEVNCLLKTTTLDRIIFHFFWEIIQIGFAHIIFWPIVVKLIEGFIVHNS